MRIARVKLTGFKSFVDPVELRIMPGLTGVVGPNGCGKSNLLEAIRWAMGEGSPKSLRGAAMDDVIFAGTERRPQRQFAEVSILAERPGDDDVEVVRRIERGAGSAYRINGRDARARDAQLIFADAATGAHSPALVSQGRIGAVIAAKPAERRAMLEEAAGISGLHVRRKEAEIRLRATEANLARVSEAVAEMEARIAVLRRQARSAERYRRISDDIRTSEARLIYARWRDAAAAADVARAEAKTAEEGVVTASEAQRAAAAWSADATALLAAARSSAQSARDAASDARHRLVTIENEHARVAARLAELSDQAERLAADRERESELARDAGDALDRLAAEIIELDARIADARTARPGLVEAAGAAEAASRASEVALAEARADAARAGAERRVAEAALTAARAGLMRAEEAAARAVGEQQAAPDPAAALVALEETAAVRERIVVEAEAARARLDSAEAARGDAAGARDAAETASAAAKARLASLEAEAAALARDMAGGEGVLTEVRAARGYETALAAALDGDLAATIGEGPRRWTRSDAQPNEPALAAGPPLADFVLAPPELARRLAQVAVVEDDDGAPLAVGQRIVTIDGRMRRWDGFRADGAGASTAERLKRRNRLVEVETLCQAAREEAAEAAETLARANSALSNASASLNASRAARETSEAALRESLRTEDQARMAHEAAVGRTEEILSKRARADADTRVARAEFERAEQAVAALPALEDASVLDGLECEATTAREAVVAARADLSAFDGTLAASERRLIAASEEAQGWRDRSGRAGRRAEDLVRRTAKIEAEIEGLSDAPDTIDRERTAATAANADLAERAAEAVEAERKAEATLREREGEAARVAETLATAREARAGAQARAENQELRRVEMGRVASERFECSPPLLPEKAGFEPNAVGPVADESSRLERLSIERERLGPVNLVAESELAEIEEGRDTNAAEIAELTEATHRLRGSIGSLNREGRERLRAAFEAVDGHFRTLFATLFNGGEAHLALIDSDDPLEAGLEIMAQPPGKKLASLTLLSGGEQALTAVALIFALFLTNPAPLCVLDEVDAPLDDANVERFCDLLDAMARDTDTRYLIVTHNAVTMSRMHRLYGVTMVEQGVSRLVSVDLVGAEELLAAE